MMIDTKGLSDAIAQANELSSKPNLTKQEERRYNFLLSAISAIKSGASFSDLSLEFTNEIRRQHGIKPVAANGNALPVEQEQRAKGFKTFLSMQKTEHRAMVEGNPTDRLGTYTNLGTFIPTDWLDRLYSALGEYDALFNEEDCTVYRTPDGRAIPIPTLGDIETVATIVGESSSRTPTPLAATGQVPLNVYTFDSRPLQVSIEAAQDMVGALNLMTWAESVFASRLARGIGKKLINGSGSGEPLGILSALEGIGVTPVTAAGSAANTGDNTQTGANSIGSADLANLIGALDSAYLASSKAAFMMNRNTLAFLNGLVSKMGTLIGLVQYVNGQPTILGLPVKISPTLPNIGASTTPILVGDFSYWCTRLVNAGDGREQIGIYNYSETTDVIENGLVEVAAFTRAGGAFLYTDNGSPSPIIPLRMHS